MGIEHTCGACGRPINLNGYTAMVAGYCGPCSAQMQQSAQSQSANYQNSQRLNKHSWERTDYEWYRCRLCGLHCSVYSNADSVIFGCSAAKRQEYACKPAEKEVSGERVPDVLQIGHEEDQP